MLVVMKDDGFIDVSDLPSKISRTNQSLELTNDIGMISGTYQDMVNMYEKKTSDIGFGKDGRRQK